MREGLKMQDIDALPIRRYMNLINYKNEKEEIEQVKALDEAGL